MTTPDGSYPSPAEPQPVPTPQAGPLQGFFDAIRRTGIVRTQDRVFGGVAAGIAHRMGISVAAMRVILVLCVIFLGLSLWVYVAAWILLPDQATGRILLQSWLTPAPQ